MARLDLSAPTGRLRFVPIPAATAAAVVIEHHYLHRRPPISHAFGLTNGVEVVGVCTFGTPASGHLCRGVCPAEPGAVVELNRLWLSDELQRNSESRFLAQCLKAMPPRIVVSYADLAFGHVGIVYRAANFRYAGWTDMDRRTPRLDYIPHATGKHTREATRSGTAYTVRRTPKVRYWTTTGGRADRRRLATMCAWPSLDWRLLPPPTFKAAA